MSSGGGSSSTDYPSYVKETHEALLRGKMGDTGSEIMYENIHMLEQVRAAIADNPFEQTGSEIANPTYDLNLIYSRLTSYKDYLVTLDRLDDFDTITSRIKSALNTYIKEEIDYSFNNDIENILQLTENKASSLIQNKLSVVAGDTGEVVNSIATNLQGSLNTIIDNLSDNVFSGLKDVRTNTYEDSLNAVTTYINRSVSAVETIFQSAITTALSLIEESVVTNAVTDFEDNTRSRHLIGVGRFAAEMSSTGAHNSSAFAIGKALKESERARDVNKFESDLKLELTKLIVSLQPGVVTQISNQQSEQFKNEMSLKLQQYLEVYKEHFRFYSLYLAESLNVAKLFYTDHGQTFNQVGSAYLNPYTETLRLQKQKENAFIIDSLKNNVALYESEIGREQNKYLLESDFRKFYISAWAAYSEAGAERFVSGKEWSLDSFQPIANLLASAAGGAVTKPTKMTKTQKIAGGAAIGALGGAKVGSMIGSGGGPIGAGLGAGIGMALGGIAGLID